MNENQQDSGALHKQFLDSAHKWPFLFPPRDITATLCTDSCLRHTRSAVTSYQLPLAHDVCYFLPVPFQAKTLVLMQLLFNRTLLQMQHASV